MQTEQTNLTDQKVTVKKGSTIKFLNCFDNENNCFLAIFTDWNEIRKWTEEDVSGFIMPAKDAWDFVSNQSEVYSGIVINPGSIGWTLQQENIQNLLEDFNKKK